MESFLNLHFKLNGKNFASEEILRKHAAILVENGENDDVAIGNFILEWLNDSDFVKVKTSGSTGTPKTIKLHKKNMYNSASATVTYFKLLEGTKALLCMPSEYIAGKMMLVRAMIAGWNLYTAAPEKNPLKRNDSPFDFTAMVPYQVLHSLAELHKVKKLIVGGGAVPWQLEAELQSLSTSIFATYGMTETISHIAVRPINGKEKSDVFSALPKVDFALTETGCLIINAPEISEAAVVTNDVVELLSPTSFKFLGRIDNVINSGGIKIHPEAVETKLSPYINKPFFIASEKNDALGEQVILLVEAEEQLLLQDFSEALQALSTYEKPKKIYTLQQFAYTDTGKIKRGDTLKKVIKS
ncbi:AMP-binding protein [Aequorivita marina]|uniref:AMP-binding protein n=1 Tax=Aequorivita marina TaxID=3073654 RepID=UPI0028744110|nr:AMP-binding protein [Aequorivita sp. S2608]MDS1299214.1 AMP-binding protein [Aequorivita sp. S2608]